MEGGREEGWKDTVTRSVVASSPGPFPIFWAGPGDEARSVEDRTLSGI